MLESLMTTNVLLALIAAINIAMWLTFWRLLSNDKNVRHTHSRHCERSEAISIKKETLRLPRPSNEGLAMTC